MVGQRGRPRKNPLPQPSPDAIEWYTLPDGRHGFLGIINGQPRNVIADTAEELHELAKGMR